MARRRSGGFGRKFGRAAARGGKKFAWAVAVGIAVLGSSAWFWPDEASKAASAASDETGISFPGLFSGSELDNVTREVALKYQAGVIEHLATVESPMRESETFAAHSTAQSGSAALFEIMCGGDECGETTSGFAEPLTFWSVTVPFAEGATGLRVTAGAAVLLVEFE